MTTVNLAAVMISNITPSSTKTVKVKGKAKKLAYSLLCLFGEAEMQRLTVVFEKEPKKQVRKKNKKAKKVQSIIAPKIDFDAPKQAEVEFSMTVQQYEQQVRITENLAKPELPNPQKIKFRVANKFRFKDIFTKEIVALFPEIQEMLVQTKVEEIELAKGDEPLSTDEIIALLLESKYGYDKNRKIIGFTIAEVGELACYAFPRLRKLLPNKFENCSLEDLDIAFSVIEKENESNFYFNKPMFNKRSKKIKSLLAKYLIMKVITIKED